MLNDNERMEGSWKCGSNKIKENIGWTTGWKLCDITHIFSKSGLNLLFFSNRPKGNFLFLQPIEKKRGDASEFCDSGLFAFSQQSAFKRKLQGVYVYFFARKPLDW